MATWYTGFSRKAAMYSGHYLAFIVALGFVVVWAISGPFSGFSKTWRLVINTSTTIITFLMVFLVQSSQNRDSEPSISSLTQAGNPKPCGRGSLLAGWGLGAR